MFRKIEPHFNYYPHKNPRILHAPGECTLCDRHPDWQELRIAWGIAFTGHKSKGIELPDPVIHAHGNLHGKAICNNPENSPVPYPELIFFSFTNNEDNK